VRIEDLRLERFARTLSSPCLQAQVASGPMSLWGRIFAAGYDSFMGPPEKAVLRGHRKALLDRVKGRVLEIGGGTGANLPFYGGGIEELVITEPEEPMARRLERKLGDYPLATRVVRARAEELPFEDERFDFVVSTLVLCTVDDPARARAAGDPPAAQAERPAPVCRACPLRPASARPLAGPPPRPPGSRGARLPLQPPNAGEHQRRWLLGGARARHAAQSTADRAAAHRGRSRANVGRAHARRAGLCPGSTEPRGRERAARPSV
jgi:hypothetical protein